MKKKIWIIGGNGVAGWGFKLVEKEYPEHEFIFSTSKECDLTNLNSVDKEILKLKPHAIIHLAAKSGGVGLNKTHPATLLRDNILMGINILEAARLHKIDKTIVTLSTGMYPPNAPLPIKEEAIHEGAAHPSVAAYSYAKRLMEPAIRAYRDEYKLNVIGLVPNGIFGTHDNFNFETATMLPSLLRRFYENRNNNEKIMVWGDGSPLREYTYSLDIARAFIWCLENYNDAQILNIGSTEEHSIKNMALMLCDALKIDRERLFFDTTKPGGVFRKTTDNSKFVSLSKFQYTPLKTAIEKVSTWYDEESKKGGGIIRK